jgi:hypothetical protein
MSCSSIIEVMALTNDIINTRLKRLSSFCNTCKDDKQLCDVCTIKAMRYALRNFQIVFDKES